MILYYITVNIKDWSKSVGVSLDSSKSEPASIADSLVCFDCSLTKVCLVSHLLKICLG